MKRNKMGGESKNNTHFLLLYSEHIENQNESKHLKKNILKNIDIELSSAASVG